VEDCTAALYPGEQSLSEWHASYVSDHKSRIALDLDIIKERVSEGSAVLEFGSVPLLFTVALSASNFNVTGIDIAPERYEETIENNDINVIRCDIEKEKLPLASNSFDAAVFNELFEHLRINPIFTLSEVLRVLKPGGIMMLSTPNLRSLAGIYNFLVRNRAYSCSGNIYAEYQKMKELGHMGHVREYTTTEISEFLENVGFKIESVIYRGQFDTEYTLLNRPIQLFTGLFPSLRPFVSYVAKKPK
jgi:SAM-dependent methyltransferase